MDRAAITLPNAWGKTPLEWSREANRQEVSRPFTCRPDRQETRQSWAALNGFESDTNVG